MTVIKPAESRKALRDAVALDLGDLRVRAERMQAEAREAASRLVEEAKAERERILAGAAEEGRRAGHAEGRAAGLEEGRARGRDEAFEAAGARLGELADAWGRALERFETDRHAMTLDARDDVIRFAADLAARVTRRAVSVEPDRVRDQVAHALELVLDPTRLVVRVHPEDQPLVEEAMPALSRRLRGGGHAEVVADDSLERGSCVVETSRGTIDASIGAQLDRIAHALLPGVQPHDEPPQ
jgi:flagellar assembly protein FliH